MTAPPTDEELAAWESTNGGGWTRQAIPRLVAEVRRLRRQLDAEQRPSVLEGRAVREALGRVIRDANAFAGLDQEWSTQALLRRLADAARALLRQGALLRQDPDDQGWRPKLNELIRLADKREDSALREGVAVAADLIAAYHTGHDANGQPVAADWRRISQETEEAIEAAFWEYDAERARTGADRYAFKGQMRRLLRGFPSAPLTHLSSPWVAVSERLPERGERVLLAMASGAVMLGHRRRAVTDEFLDQQGAFFNEQPLFWMPLPKGPTP